MKTNITLFIIILLLSSSCKNDLEYQMSCGEDIAWDLENCWTCGDDWTDLRDNQTYRTKQFGNQCWFMENLKVGECIEAIPENVKDDENINYFCFGGCFSDNSCENGGLYNWHEATGWSRKGDQGICPNGWGIPSKGEFEYLANTITSGESLPYKTRELINQFETAFDVIYTGYAYRGEIGRIYRMLFLTIDEIDNNNGSTIFVEHLDSESLYNVVINDTSHFVYTDKINSFCIRCIKDN